MTQHVPWQLAFEALAYVPVTLGYRPAESAVVLTYGFEDGHFILGASARFDLDVFEHGGGERFTASVMDTLAQTESRGAIVAWYGDRTPAFWARAMAQLTAVWPFAEHGGFFRVTDLSLDALGADGLPVESRDPIELSATVVAMNEAGGLVGEDETALLLPRGEADTEAYGAALGEIDVLPPIRLFALWSRALRRTVRRGEAESPLALAACATGLDNPYVRDGFLGWVLSGLTLRGPLHEISPEAMAGSAEPPSREAIELALAGLASMVRDLPPGAAASPLACAAFLSWYSGWGARARVLAEQALADRPVQTLAQLVLDLVAASCPPPWVKRSALPWMIPADPAA